MSEKHRVEVPVELAGVRADRVLSQLSDLSRAKSQNLIESGAVTIGGEPIARGHAVAAGDVIEYLVVDESATLQAEDVAFAVAYEAGDVIVVDKPPGLVVHPGAGHASGTLANGLIARFPELEALGEQYRWGLVHRLDRDTSGLLLVARTAEMHSFLQQELKARRIERTYVALVAGALDAATGTIDAPVGRDPLRPTRMAVVQDGRPARTHYRRLAEWSGVTLVELSLETGRTHQIRVHLSSIGLGVVGDQTYGRGLTTTGDVGRVWLHARRLRFAGMDGRRHEVVARLPADLRRGLSALGEPSAGTVAD